MARKSETPDWAVAYKLPGEKPRYRKCHGRTEAREIRYELELEGFDTALYRHVHKTWHRYDEHVMTGSHGNGR